MSLTSYRAAPSRATKGKGAALWPPLYEQVNGLCLLQSASFNAWRRPTLPGLEPQYHRRRLVSRPSSGWDRVGHRRYGHQAMKLALWVLIDAVHGMYIQLLSGLRFITTSLTFVAVASTVIDGGTRFLSKHSSAIRAIRTG